MLNKNDRDFWDEVSRVSRSRTQQTLSVDEADDEDKINELFTSKYNSLYNSVSYDRVQLEDLNRRVDRKVQCCFRNECHTVHFVSAEEVSAAVKRLRLHKGDVDFELSSNHIIHGGPALALHMSRLFNLMLSHGFTPPSMNLSTLCPIIKSPKKSVSDSANYRAIAIGSVFSKVLDHVIMMKCKRQLCTSDLQFGFKEKSSTTQCTFVLNGRLVYSKWLNLTFGIARCIASF